MSSSTDKPAPKPNRLWGITVILLLAFSVIAIITALVRHHPTPAIEINLPSAAQTTGSIQVGGAVANPGIYPFSGNDTVQSILDAAGGTTSSAQGTVISLDVVPANSESAAQKININRADAWLLQALPGVGETKAQTIVAYRTANGPFKTTGDLMKVSGIGESLFNQIKDLITVTDF